MCAPQHPLHHTGAFYLRLVARALDVYNYLEPLYNDYRRIRIRLADGSFALTHVDELVDQMLHTDYMFDIALPRISVRLALEASGALEPRVSVLDDEFDEQALEEEAARAAQAAHEAEQHAARERQAMQDAADRRSRSRSPRRREKWRRRSASPRNRRGVRSRFVDGVGTHGGGMCKGGVCWVWGCSIPAHTSLQHGISCPYHAIPMITHPSNTGLVNGDVTMMIGAGMIADDTAAAGAPGTAVAIAIVMHPPVVRGGVTAGGGGMGEGTTKRGAIGGEMEMGGTARGMHRGTREGENGSGKRQFPWNRTLKLQKQMHCVQNWVSNHCGGDVWVDVRMQRVRYMWHLLHCRR